MSITRAWERYERCRRYNSSLTPSQYDLVNTNIQFFSGNQWVNIRETPAMQRLPRPVFNIIKRVVSLFVASLTSSAASITFEELREGEGADCAAAATGEVQNLFEKFKMDYRIREALFDGAQTGDYCAHFYWDADAVPYGGTLGSERGEIKMELVDGINVLFGNPNTPDVERQPYILIVGRENVEKLREEMGRHRGDILPDSEWDTMAGDGGRRELDGEDGKALYVYMYEKKKGTVRVTKATRDAVIFENIDTGLSRYPIAWGNWEKQKNQYHGKALVTDVIPNQIFINTMFAMVMRHLQLMGFPKTVYNADLVGRWSNEVGQAIGVRGLQPGQSVSQVAYHMPGADMSAQIIAAIDKAVSCTKDCLGATDAQLGNVRPDNTSALMVLQRSAEVPLENTRAGLYEWLEDIGAILLDMMGTYYGRRTVVRSRTFEEPVLGADGVPKIDPATGKLQVETVSKKVAELFDFRVFKNLWFHVRVNVGASTYFSEIAMVQTLDNLRRDGTLELIDYLERVPDKLIPRKAELIAALRERQASPDGAEAMPSGYAVGGELSEDKLFAALPAGMQSRYDSLPRKAQKALKNISASGSKGVGA